jgi:signal transduction histidine kinase
VDVPRVSVARYELDGTATDCASFPPDAPATSIGKRWSLEGTNVLKLVRTSCASARIDDYAQLDGELAEAVRRVGIHSTVGVPIMVAGRLWGAMMVSTREPDPLPTATAARLASFTELLATAIANAESREALGRLADEQTALRRVATQVAQGVGPAEVFGTVADELAHYLDTRNAGLIRYEVDGTAYVVAAQYEPGITTMPITGEHFPLGNHVGGRVLRTGRAARIDDHENISGPGAARVRAEGGIGSIVGVPVVVDGRLWGAAIVGSRQPMLADAEARVADFADLVATAIANAATRTELQGSRDALGVLAEQQAALRRVATLVARGTPPSEVFAAVANEMARCLHAANVTVSSFDDDMVTIVAVAALTPGIKHAPLVGIRRTLSEGDNIATRVFQTGQPARLEGLEFQKAPGLVAGWLRKTGLRSTVAVPIVVDGRVWGMAALGSLLPEPMPPDTEARMSDFADLVGTAITNAATRAELIASRARIVAAADEGRRRLERDLHDGAQQRLVALGLQTRLAEAAVPPEMQALKQQLCDIVSALTGVSADLQEISRGIHPAILSMGGLGPALKTLARRSAIPVTLDLTIDQRPQDSVEVGAYYVVSEALTNAAKHSRATQVTVSGHTKDHALSLSIRDDGIGGADKGNGSGLVGLADRVEALGGRMRVNSPPGRGTSLEVSIPLDGT